MWVGSEFNLIMIIFMSLGEGHKEKPLKYVLIFNSGGDYMNVCYVQSLLDMDLERCFSLF